MNYAAALVAAAGALLIARAVAAESANRAFVADLVGPPEADPPAAPGAGMLDDVAALDAAAYGPAAYGVTMNDPDANLSAFLAAIRRFESADDARGYRMLMGGQLFTRFDDHPAALGWKGTPLPDATCRAAGFGPGCVSTAAGAYQLILPTWRRVARKLQLPDFSPASQDAAALQLLAERGALELVKLGRFDAAIQRARREWASMPASGWGQPEGSLTAWRTAYVNAGGALA